MNAEALAKGQNIYGYVSPADLPGKRRVCCCCAALVPRMFVLCWECVGIVLLKFKEKAPSCPLGTARIAELAIRFEIAELMERPAVVQGCAPAPVISSTPATGHKEHGSHEKHWTPSVSAMPSIEQAASSERFSMASMRKNLNLVIQSQWKLMPLLLGRLNHL